MTLSGKETLEFHKTIARAERGGCSLQRMVRRMNSHINSGKVSVAYRCHRLAGGSHSYHELLQILRRPTNQSETKSPNDSASEMPACEHAQPVKLPQNEPRSKASLESSRQPANWSPAMFRCLQTGGRTPQLQILWRRGGLQNGLRHLLAQSYQSIRDIFLRAAALARQNSKTNRANCAREGANAWNTPNDQLTDGGPWVTLELPSRVAGPAFGAAFG